MLHVVCPCGKKLRLAESYVGKSAPCPSCGHPVRVAAKDVRPMEAPTYAALIVESGPQRVGERILLTGHGTLEVGKLEDRDVHLLGSRVSRLHARLVPMSGGWRIEDCGSTNGIFANGQRVQVHSLRNGDSIRIGDYIVRFVDGPQPTTDAPGAVERRTVPPRAAAPGAAGAVARRSVLPRAAAPGAVGASSRSAAPAPRAKAPPPPPKEDDGLYGFSNDDLLGLADGEAIEVAPSIEPATRLDHAGVPVPVDAGDGPECPSCHKRLPSSAVFCVDCGINVKTGRAILTSQDTNLDSIYTTTEGVLRWLSWIIPLGLYPIASEAFGTRKPWTVRGVAVLTTLISFWFLSIIYSDSPSMAKHKELMLWSAGPPTPEFLEAMYEEPSLGDTDAFKRAFRAARDEELAKIRKKDRDTKGSTAPSKAATDESDEEEFEEIPREVIDAAIVKAHESLPPEKQCVGHYSASQLLTNTFLHAGPLHLAGNLLFLLVFGSRVNALIGNTLSLLIYPLLAIGASWVHLASVAGEEPMASLGASGAVMGLAGMYLVLMPLHKVHMAFWWRLPGIALFRLKMHIFEMRGFWVVLFYIAFDVVYTLWRIEDDVAHWAHLGGFLIGAGLAILLLVTRLVNARGGDLLSAVLGRHAWAIIGPPNRPGIALP